VGAAPDGSVVGGGDGRASFRIARGLYELSVVTTSDVRRLVPVVARWLADLPVFQRGRAVARLAVYRAGHRARLRDALGSAQLPVKARRAVLEREAGCAIRRAGFSVLQISVTRAVEHVGGLVLLRTRLGNARRRGHLTALVAFDGPVEREPRVARRRARLAGLKARRARSSLGVLGDDDDALAACSVLGPNVAMFGIGHPLLDHF
jgi:hypothetical protein